MIEINNSLKFKYQVCICGYDATEIVTSETRHEDFLPVVRCTKCSTLFMKYYPDDPSLSNYYKNIYRIVKHKNETPAELFKKQLVRGNKAYKGFKEKAVSEPNGKLLDYGGASGGVSFPFSSDYETFLFDLDPVFTDYAESQGHKILKELEVEQNGLLFDVVLLSHVIEHITDPEPFLEKLKKLLSENGVLVISTTFVESSLRRHNCISFTKDIHLAHKFYFSYNTLCKLLLRINMAPVVKFDDWIVYKKSTEKSFKKSKLSSIYDSFLIYTLSRMKFGLPIKIRKLIKSIIR